MESHLLLFTTIITVVIITTISFVIFSSAST